MPIVRTYMWSGEMPEDSYDYDPAAPAAPADSAEPRQKVAVGPHDRDEPHDIGWAVQQMWNGGIVRRQGWNGKNMGLKMQKPAYVFMRTAQGEVPWLCSQTDLLATDWEEARSN